MNSTKERCYCHGISGSCTIQTCFPELPEFSVLARRLKQAYNESCKAVSNGGSSLTWTPVCDRQVTSRDHLYRDTRDWCVPDSAVGSIGTFERVCDPHQDAPNSCTKLCTRCGLGFREHTTEFETPCHCKFHFCCEVKCSTCRKKETFYTCSSYR